MFCSPVSAGGRPTAVGYRGVLTGRRLSFPLSRQGRRPLWGSGPPLGLHGKDSDVTGLHWTFRTIGGTFRVFAFDNQSLAGLWLSSPFWVGV